MWKGNNMIIPHPESDLKLNVLVLGSELIEYMKRKNKFVIIEEIMGDFLKKDKKRTPDLFIDTLIFLFLTDIIEYKGYKVRIKKNDFTQTNLF